MERGNQFQELYRPNITQMFLSPNAQATNTAGVGERGTTTQKRVKSHLSPDTAPHLSIFEVAAIQYQNEKSRRELAETLCQMNEHLSQTLDLAELLPLILKYLADLVPYQRAALMMLQADELKVVAAKGFPAAVSLEQLTVSLKKESVFRQVYQIQRSVFIPDMWHYANGHSVADLPPTRTWLGIPLLHSGKFVGMLSIMHPSPKAYGVDQIKATTQFARQTAIALENARLQQRLIQTTRQLKTMVYERTQALQTAYAQLEYLEETKADFIGIAGHELRTPLAIMQGYSDLLLQEAVIKETPYLKEVAASLHSGTQRICQVVNSMLDVAKIDSQSLKLYPELIPLSPLVESIVYQFEKALLERNLTLQVEGLEGLPDLEADVEALQKVVTCLISNAIKFTPDGGTIRLKGRYLAEGPQGQPGIQMTICDTGIGVAPEVQSLIFTKFYRAEALNLHSTGQTKFKGAGPGLGLTIAHGIIRLHGGQLWVESPGRDEETCPGSQFHLVLPLRQGER